MVAVIAIVVGITVILLFAVPWLVKAVSDMEQGAEDHLHDPATQKVSYEVPNGVDAAVLSTAVEAAGFASALDLAAGEERLLIECHTGERERLREVIARVNEQQYAPAGLTTRAVRFTDESAL